MDAALSPASRTGKNELMLDKKLKLKIINKYKVHDNDTGSSNVQIAILSEEIRQLAEHLKVHKHDHSSRRGLLRKVGERRRLLKYLQKEDAESFKKLSKLLKLDISKKMVEDEEEEARIERELLEAAELKAHPEEEVVEEVK